QGSALRIVDQFEQSVASPRTLEEVEKEYITRILDETSWRVEGTNGAAKILGLNPSTLRTRMAKLGVLRRFHVAGGRNH
ncbi:MAG TPA: helix-turn-helix domain-containing protein, partial [Pyrinomonadaceae bacterium]|nr:helix-turn-helix domain-containing protein [Pyrinomonadaceae bacterium]